VNTAEAAAVEVRAAPPAPGRIPTGYAGDWALFTDWCAATGQPSCPPSVRTVEAFLAGCPAAPATAARRVAALLWHYRHSPTVDAENPPARRELLGLPAAGATRPPPDPAAVAAAVRALPVSGWTGGFFGRRDAALLTVATSPLSWTALAALRTFDITVDDGVLCLPGGSGLAAGGDPATCPPCVWLRWLRTLGLARREVSIRPLRAALDRGAPLTGAGRHRCRTTVASAPDDPRAGAVFVPIDQHGYPDLRRALAPTSLARLTARHLDGRPPPRRIIAPAPRPAESEAPLPATPPPPPPPPPPGAATLQAAHRHALDRRRDDLRQLDALDRLLDELEREAAQANEQMAVLARLSSV
jgi:hypothetical protein